MKPHRRTAISIAILVLAGCTDSGSTGSGTRASDPVEIADRYGYDLRNPSLTPVYALIPEYNDPRDGYARDLLARRCLEGVIEYRPINLGEGDEFSDERTGQPVFNERVASRWGYSANRLNATFDTAVAENVTITEAMSKAMQQCGQEADDRLGRPPIQLPVAIEGAGWDAILSDDAVDDAAATWRRCMEPAGVVDLPLRPDEGPPRSVLTEGSLEETEAGDLTSNQNVPPSAREIEVAAFDARCREESGFTRAALVGRATAELAAIGRNLEEFDAVRDEYRRYATGIDNVIAELG